MNLPESSKYDFPSSGSPVQILHILREKAEQHNVIVEPDHKGANSLGDNRDEPVTVNVSLPMKPGRKEGEDTAQSRPQRIELATLPDGRTRVRLCLHEETEKAIAEGDVTARSVVTRLSDFARQIAASGASSSFEAQTQATEDEPPQ